MLVFTQYLLARLGLELNRIRLALLKRYAVSSIPRETGYSFYQSGAQFDTELGLALKGNLAKCVKVDEEELVFDKSENCIEKYLSIIEYERKYEVPHIRSAILAVDPEIDWLIYLAGGKY